MDRIIKLYGLCAVKGSNGRGYRYKFYFKVRLSNLKLGRHMAKYKYRLYLEYIVFKHYMTYNDYISLKIYKLSYQCYLSH